MQDFYAGSKRLNVCFILLHQLAALLLLSGIVSLDRATL